MEGIPKKRQKQYAAWKEALGDADYKAIVAELRRRIDSLKSEKKSFISSQLPSSDWPEALWGPINRVCGQCTAESGFLFGLIVWEYLVEDGRCWMFRPATRDEDDVIGKAYWQIECPGR